MFFAQTLRYSKASAAKDHGKKSRSKLATSFCGIVHCTYTWHADYILKLGTRVCSVLGLFYLSNLELNHVVFNTYFMKQPDLYYFKTIKITSQAGQILCGGYEPQASTLCEL